MRGEDSSIRLDISHVWKWTGELSKDRGWMLNDFVLEADHSRFMSAWERWHLFSEHRHEMRYNAFTFADIGTLYRTLVAHKNAGGIFRINPIQGADSPGLIGVLMIETIPISIDVLDGYLCIYFGNHRTQYELHSVNIEENVKSELLFLYKKLLQIMPFKSHNELVISYLIGMLYEHFCNILKLYNK